MLNKLFLLSISALVLNACTVAKVASMAVGTPAKIGVGAAKTAAKAGGAVSRAITPDDDEIYEDDYHEDYEEDYQDK